MEKVRVPVFKLVYAGKDITQDVSRYLINVTYTDNTANESDEISFTMEDSKGLWRGPWYAGKGDKVELQIGYDTELLNCGVFTVDEIDMQGPPDIVTIRALASGINSPLRTKNSRAFEGQSLREIAKAVADKYGYTIEDGVKGTANQKVSYQAERDLLTRLKSLVSKANTANQVFRVSRMLDRIAGLIGGRGKKAEEKFLKSLTEQGLELLVQNGANVRVQKYKAILNQGIDRVLGLLVDTTKPVSTVTNVLDGIRVERVTQDRETDLEFLRKLAEQYGISFSVRGTKLVFMSIYDVEKGQVVSTLDRTNLIRYSIKDKATKTYKKARIRYKNPKSNELISKEIEGNDIGVENDYKTAPDTLEIHVKAENLKQAEEKARAQLHRANTKNQEGAILVEGNPYLCAGNNFTLTGMGALSGLYHIKRSTHALSTSGYTTDMEVKRIGGGESVNVGDTQSLGEVLFASDSAVITNVGKSEIDKVVAFMRKNEGVSIEIGGHTDSQASDEYNQDLSERRANAVMQYMIANGIFATRLKAKGYGESNPVASNETDSGRQKNRRTEFVVIKTN